MRNTVDFVLKNKLAVWILTIIFIFSGLYSGANMNRESIPNVDIPYLIISTVYPGATPETVNKEISSLIENRLKEVEKVKNVNSTSQQNVSIVTLEFEYGANVIDLKAAVQKELDALKFDDVIQEPTILSLDMNMLPVVSMSLSSDTLTTEALATLIQKELTPALSELEGVNQVETSGLIEEKIKLTFNNDVLKTIGLTQEQIIQMIQASNVDMSLGLIEFTKNKEAVAIYGAKHTLESLQKLHLPIPLGANKMATLGDLATLEMITKQDSISRVNGENSFAINITKGQVANTVNVADLVKEKTNSFVKKYKDVTITYVLDQSIEINHSVQTMLTKAIFGTLCAIFIILFFLRNVRSTIISVVSIPLSILISAFVLDKLGVTMNIMSLGAMTVAIGRIIDDSIVVVENIFRRLHDKEEALQGRALIKEATLQMFVPILSSTLVTIAVFLPLLLVGGIVGELFMPFALTMILTLLASLVVAVTIVPVMAHSMFRKEIYGAKTINNSHEKPSKLSNAYAKGLTWTLNHKRITISTVVVMMVATGFLASKLTIGFMNEEETTDLSYAYQTDNSETEAEIIESLRLAEAYLLDRKDVEVVQATYGSDNELTALFSTGSGGSLTITFDSISDKNKAKNSIIENLQDLPVKGTWEEQEVMSMFGGHNVTYSFYGTTLEDLTVAVTDAKAILEKEKEIIEVKSTLNDVYKENQFTILDKEVSKYGLTTAQVGMILYQQSNEKNITSITNEQGKTYSVVTQTNVDPVDSLDDLLSRVIGVSPVTGKPVTVKDVVDVKEGTTVSSVTKENGKLVAQITGEVKGDVSITTINERIEKNLHELKLPPGVNLTTGGTTAQIQESFTQLAKAMIAAIAIVYFILVLTFKEGLAPLAILFSLPVTIIGVVIALVIADLPLDISGMLGLLMLIGIVVTNAIVYIDRVLENEYGGKDTREALIEAGKTRLRPILMTAIATVTALIPLAIGAESGGLISQGLAITVIGGLVSSTLLTLFIVPVVFEALSKWFKKDRKNMNWD